MKVHEANGIIDKPMVFSINDGTVVTGTITELRQCENGAYAMIKADSMFKEGWYRLDTIISCVASITMKKKTRKGK